MGFLSQNADKAFKKASKRAYVPPWWKPASYLAGGVAAALVLVLGVVNSGDPPAQYASSNELEGAGQVGTVRQEIIINPTPGPGGSTTPNPSPGSTSSSTPGAATTGSPETPSPQPTASPSGPGSANEFPTPSGGSMIVDQQALALARKAALALYTGNFSGVPIYDNLQPPTITRKWPKASFEEVSSADDLSGQGYIFQISMDPDGPSQPEAPREVQVIVIKSGSSWFFQPF